MYKYFLPLVAAALLLFGYSAANAAPLYSAQRSLIPFADSQYFLGTTTPGTLAWKGAVVDELCLTGDVCITAWPTGGGGTISTSTDLVDGQVIVATGADTIGGITNVATGRVLISQGASAAPIWSETATLGTALISPVISAQNNASISNFRVGSASTIGCTSTNSQLIFAGAATVQCRSFFNGNTATTLTAGNGYAGLIIGGQPATEGSSGTHPLLAGVVINAPAITNGSAATTDLTSLYIAGAPTGITPTNTATALWIDTGILRVDDQVGIGTSSPPRTLSVQAAASPNVASFLGSNASYINVHRTSQASNSGLQLGVNSSGGYEVFGKTTHSLRLGTNDTEYVTILNGGNTGIGTSTPFTKLGVAGDAYIGGNLTATGTVTVTGTATSTFSGPIQSTCFSTDGTTCITGGSASVLATSSVQSVPTSSGTTTITHNLGQTPTVIRLTVIGPFESSASGRKYSTSEGVWTTANGNSGVGQGGGGGAQDAINLKVDLNASKKYSGYMENAAGTAGAGFFIGNVTSTTFDIGLDFTFGSSFTANSGKLLWEAQ